MDLECLPGQQLRSLLADRFGLDDTAFGEVHQTFSERRVVHGVGDDFSVAIKIDHGREVASMEHRCAGHEHAQTVLPDHVAPLLRTVDGECCVHVEGARIQVFSWIDGRPPSLTTAVWAELGRVLADLHSAPAAPEKFAIEPDAAAEEIDSLADVLALGAELQAVADRVRTMRSSAVVTVHGEINSSNVVQRPDGGLVILDWDQAGRGLDVLDLGYPLLCVFIDEDMTWHKSAFESFYRSYSQSRPLPDPSHIMTAALMHAARYLPYARTSQRWNRIQHALQHEHQLLDQLARVSSDATLG